MSLSAKEALLADEEKKKAMQCHATYPADRNSESESESDEDDPERIE